MLYQCARAFYQRYLDIEANIHGTFFGEHGLRRESEPKDEATGFDRDI